MLSIKNAIRAFIKDEEGAALAEYGLLIALIAAVCVVVIATLGGQISEAFQKVSDKL